MDTQTILGRICKKLVIVVAGEESQRGWETTWREKDSCYTIHHLVPFEF